MPKVSVIVPYFNTKDYLSRCIESIINQSYRDIEIILINDGSTDGSDDLCKEFANLDNRIINLSISHSGVSAARNAGLNNAKGKFVAFVDSDNWISKDFIESFINVALQTNADMVIGSNIRTVTDGKEKSDTYNFRRKVYYASEFNHYIEDFYQQTIVWNKLYKACLFKNLRFKENFIHEDDYICHQIIDVCNIIAISERGISYRYRRVGSIMLSDATVEKLDAVEAYIERYLNLYNKKLYHYCEFWMNVSINLFGMLYYKIKNHDDCFKHRVSDLIKKEKESYRSLDKRNLGRGTKRRFGLFVFSPKLYFKLRRLYAKKKS